MSDYRFYVGVSRDDVVSELIENGQETSYVFAEYADRTAKTSTRDDLLDMLEGLSSPHKGALAHLCKQILDRLDPEDSNASITLTKPQARLLGNLVISRLESTQGDGPLSDEEGDLLAELNQKILQQTMGAL